MWAGLGYYRRARFLLNGARHVCGLPPIGDETRGDDATRLANIAASFPTSAKGLANRGVPLHCRCRLHRLRRTDRGGGNVTRVAARRVRDGGDATKPGRARAREPRRRVVGRAPSGSQRVMMEPRDGVRPQNPDCEACPRRSIAARALRVATASDAEPRRRVAAREGEEGDRREEPAAPAVEATRHADGVSALLLVRRPEEDSSRQGVSVRRHAPRGRGRGRAAAGARCRRARVRDHAAAFAAETRTGTRGGTTSSRTSNRTPPCGTRARWWRRRGGRDRGVRGESGRGGGGWVSADDAGGGLSSGPAKARARRGRRGPGGKTARNAAAGQGERHREDVRRAEEKEDGESCGGPSATSEIHVTGYPMRRIRKGTNRARTEQRDDPARRNPARA